MLKAAPLFTDGAVLCRGKEIRVFGEVSDGEKVTVTLSDREGTLLAQNSGTGREGRFLVSLPPQSARTGCFLTISAGAEELTARDVAIGEVFLAGGQSNMELELQNADEGPGIIRQYEDSLLRFFNVPRCAVPSTEGAKLLENTRWQAIHPGLGGSNSAVAYFFAAALRKRFPELPIGIIGCYWGGTSLTCWLEEETLRTTSEGARYLDDYAARTNGKSMEQFLKEEKAFEEGMDWWNKQVEAFRRDHPEASWKEVTEACGLAPWCPPAGPGSPYRPGGLAQTMLSAVVPATLTGILYYQGEEDADKTDHYDTLMMLLINRWRMLFRDAELPFLFVQLPMWLDYDAADTYRWPRIRKAQAAARDAMRNTGMVCLLDQGEYGNIHPTAKRPVGERLAELAGHMLYGGGEISPRAISKYTEGKTMTVCLSAPVQLRKGQTAELLELAGEDGRYVPARGEIRDGKLILVADDLEHPVHARYAWTDYSDRVSLFGENELPLEPFDL